jgi:hypothetical protein
MFAMVASNAETTTQTNNSEKHYPASKESSWIPNRIDRVSYGKPALRGGKIKMLSYGKL